jgi:excisionase family DNA binding protein
MMDAQIAATLEREGYQTPGLVHPITSKIVCHLRARWQIPTVKLNHNQQNPAQWEDGSYSVEGAAAKLGVGQDTIFHWLKTGRLKGEHLGRTVHLQCACRSCGSSDDQTVRHPRTLCHFARFDSGLAQP